MKALKEKRIKVRSLWRMGLVVLSVLVLAFAACNETSTTPTEPPDTTEPGVVQSTKIPIDVFVSTPPTAAEGPVHEGMPFDLSGMVLAVRYSDNTQELRPYSEFGDRMSIEPKIYDARVGLGIPYYDGPNLGYYDGYVISYQENRVTKTTKLKLPNGVMRLVDIDVTQYMNKMTYRIDDFPELEGLSIYGYYSSKVSNISHPPLSTGGGRINVLPIQSYDPDLTLGERRIPDWAQGATFYTLPLSMDLADYKWAWVENTKPGTGDFPPDDSPGLLLSIGSFGHIESRIFGRNTMSVDDSIDTVELIGKRIAITELVQVDYIRWAKEPTWPDIYYDDPRFISATISEQAFDARMNYWLENVFADAVVEVHYMDGGDPYTFTVRELQSFNYAYGNSVTKNKGYGATWANFEVYPISRANKMIDVTRDNKDAAISIDEFVYGFDWKYGGTAKPGSNPLTTYVNPVSGNVKDEYDAYYALPEDAAEYNLINGTGAYATYIASNPPQDGQVNATKEDFRATIYGDGGWAQWAQLANGRSKLRFVWRDGIPFDVAIPIYNRPASMRVEINPRVATFTPTGGSPAVRMLGRDAVYSPSEGMAEFLSRVTVYVTYTKQGSSEPGKERNLTEALAKGQARSYVSWPDDVPAYPYNTPSATPAGSGAWHEMPTLYSTTVYNFLDWIPGTAGNTQLGNDMKTLMERLNFGFYTDRTSAEDEDALILTSEDVTPVLTRSASEAFTTKQRVSRARIEYVGWAGNPTATRTVSNRAINVAPTGYPFNWLDEDKDFAQRLDDIMTAAGYTTMPSKPTGGTWSSWAEYFLNFGTDGGDRPNT
jgi:hypothetical protein